MPCRILLVTAVAHCVRDAAVLQPMQGEAVLLFDDAFAKRHSDEVLPSAFER